MFERKNLSQQFRAQDPTQYATRSASKDVYVPKDFRRQTTTQTNSNSSVKQENGKEKK